MANEGFSEDFKNGMYHASYTAWQINETIKGIMGGNSKKGLSFNEYIKALGIDKEDKKEDKQDKNKDKVQLEIDKQKALKIANNIIQLDKRGRAKK